MTHEPQPKDSPTQEAAFVVDSQGEATKSEEVPRIPLPRGTIISVKHESGDIPLAEGDSFMTSLGGKNFLIRDTEHRVYDVDEGIWHDLPQGVDAYDFINNL